MDSPLNRLCARRSDPSQPGPKAGKCEDHDNGNVPKGEKWRCRFVAREFRHDDLEMEGLYTSGTTAATVRLVDMHAVQHGYSILFLNAENTFFRAE